MIIILLMKYFKEQQSFTLVMNLVFIQFEEFHKYLEREKDKWDNTPLVIFFFVKTSCFARSLCIGVDWELVKLYLMAVSK